MKNSTPLRQPATIALYAAFSLLAWIGQVSGQSFTSGSTGADGAFAPSCSPTPCTVVKDLNEKPDGVYHYTTVTIPSGVTVRYTPNAANTPVTILATGDVAVSGTINVAGFDGSNNVSGTVANPGGRGGPGGFNGGFGAVFTLSTQSPGQGPGGGSITGGCALPGNYGVTGNFVKLIPLFGGSGGAGGNASAAVNAVGGAGAGGGGAVLIASSSKITVTGSINANGGNTTTTADVRFGAGGSGGAIRLVARELAGSGSLQVAGGLSSCSQTPGAGRIRLEAFTPGFTGSINPSATGVMTLALTPGPVNAASNPALVNLPTLAITSVGGLAAPAVPGGSFAAADLVLPQGTANPVPVSVEATNTPVGAPTAITLRLLPVTGGAGTTVAIPAASHTGTFASSSASANVTFAVGQTSVVQAWATMTLTGQIASLFPLIDGEPVEQVRVAALDGGASTLSLMTKSGKEKRADQLDSADRLRLAQAWDALKATRPE
jgi:hypothetical protein